MIEVSQENTSKITLEEAKIWLRERLNNKGAKCPCCTQLAKIYRRSVNSTMAVFLWRLYRLTEITDKTWHNIASIVGTKNKVGSGDFSKLKYWKLIEEHAKSQEETTKKNSGIWRITEQGIDFLKNNSRIPKCALIYDGRLLRHDDTETICFRECFKEAFDFTALMERSGNLEGVL